MSLSLSGECDCQEMISRIRNPGEQGVSEGPVHPTVWKAAALCSSGSAGQREGATPACFAFAETSWLQTRQGEGVSLHCG